MVKLGETVLDGLQTTLSGNLPSELSAIETERGDGISLPAPESYYRHRRAVMKDSQVYCELYVETIEITTPETQVVGANRVDFDALSDRAWF